MQKKTTSLNARTTTIETILLVAGVILRIIWWIAPAYDCDVYLLKAGIVSKSVRQLIVEPLGRGQSAPLGFTMLTKYIGEFISWDDRILALPILALSIIAIFVWRKILQNSGISHFGRVSGMLIFAMSPQLIIYSGTLKPYAIDASIATFCCFYITKQDVFRKRPYVFPLLCTVSPFFSMGSLIVIPISIAILFYHSVIRNYRNDQAYPQFFGEKHNDQTFNFIHLLARNKIIMLSALLFATSGLLSFLYINRMMPPGMYEYWNDSFAPISFSGQSIMWHLNHLIMFFRGPIFFTWIPYHTSLFQAILAIVPISLFTIGIFAGLMRKHRAITQLLLIVAAVVFASLIHKWPIRCGTILNGRMLMFLIPNTLLALTIGLDVIHRRFYGIAYVIMAFAFLSMIHSLKIPQKIHETWNAPTLIALISNACRDKDFDFFGDKYAEPFLTANLPDLSAKIQHYNLFTEISGIDADPIPSCKKHTIFLSQDRYLGINAMVTEPYLNKVFKLINDSHLNYKYRHVGPLLFLEISPANSFETQGNVGNP